MTESDVVLWDIRLQEVVQLGHPLDDSRVVERARLPVLGNFGTDAANLQEHFTGAAAGRCTLVIIESESLMCASMFILTGRR